MNKDSISMESGYNKSMREGSLTKSIEKQTAKMPSSIFLS